MGKRSQRRMTGLSSDQRIKRSEKRTAKEAKEAAELAKAMLGLPQLEAPPEHKDVWEIPMPPGPAISPVMRQLIQLEEEKKRKKGWLDKHGR